MPHGPPSVCLQVHTGPPTLTWVTLGEVKAQAGGSPGSWGSASLCLSVPSSVLPLIHMCLLFQTTALVFLLSGDGATAPFRSPPSSRKEGGSSGRPGGSGPLPSGLAGRGNVLSVPGWCFSSSLQASRTLGLRKGKHVLPLQEQTQWSVLLLKVSQQAGAHPLLFCGRPLASGHPLIMMQQMTGLAWIMHLRLWAHAD